jgi:hypothetical protein
MPGKSFRLSSPRNGLFLAGKNVRCGGKGTALVPSFLCFLSCVACSVNADITLNRSEFADENGSGAYLLLDNASVRQ